MSEKTEQPTPKRIRDSREKGDIAKGQDLAPAATVLAFALYAIGNGETVWEELVQMTTVPMEVFHLPYEEALSKSVSLVIDVSLGIVFPVVGLVMGVALMVLLAETGFLFAPKAAAPKLENLSPTRWFKRVFSMKNLFEFAKNIVKVTVLTGIVWLVFSDYLPVLFQIPKGGLGAMWGVIGSAVGELLLYSAGAFAIVAVLD